MDVWEYFLQKEREFADFGVMPEPTRQGAAIFRADAESDGKIGIVNTNLGLDEDAYVKVYERVRVVGNNVTREAYAYAIIVDEAQVHQWDRDPTNHPESPVHEHEGPNRIREEHTESVSLKRVLELAWDEVSLRAEAPLDGP